MTKRKINSSLSSTEERLQRTSKWSLNKINAPCKIITTWSLLSSLKTPVDNTLKSWLVYKITCSQCELCYVGQTTQHLLTRFKEHEQSGTPVESHFEACNSSLTMDDVKIIAISSKCTFKLMTLEAVFIKDNKPSINTKDEFRSCALIIKI